MQQAEPQLSELEIMRQRAMSEAFKGKQQLSETKASIDKSKSKAKTKENESVLKPKKEAQHIEEIVFSEQKQAEEPVNEKAKPKKEKPKPKPSKKQVVTVLNPPFEPEPDPEPVESNLAQPEKHEPSPVPEEAEILPRSKPKDSPRHRGPHAIARRKIMYVDTNGRELDDFCLRVLSTGQIYPITGTHSIGDDTDRDIRIIGDYVSKAHARITNENSQFFIEDTNSRNGTYVNGTRINARIQIYPGDKIKFGDIQAIFDASAKEAKHEDDKDRTYCDLSLVNKATGEMTKIFNNMKIGREPENDLVIPEPEGQFVSAHHAVITIDGRDIRLRDSNSRNGTYVGKNRITSKSIYEGNIIKFADVEFEVVRC